MRRAILLLGCAFVLLHARPSAGGELNCALRMSSNFVTDLNSMFDVAASQRACLELCKAYGRESVEGMATSDVVELLEWTCLYERTPFYRKRIKPVASEEYLVAPEQSGAEPPASSSPDEELTAAPTSEEIAANKVYVGNMIAAAISGQSAGFFTYIAMTCARLDPSLTDAQLQAARNELSIKKQELIPESHDRWDEYFRIGEEEAKAEQRTYDLETCAQALDFLRSQ